MVNDIVAPAASAFTDSEMLNIFIFYGFGFLFLGIVIFLKREKVANADMAEFYYLSGFGIVHGMTEWLDALRIAIKINGIAPIPVLDMAKMLMLLASFVLLLQFGAALLLRGNKRLQSLKFLPLVAGTIFLLTTLATGTFMSSDLIIRNLFAFTGSIATAIGFLTLTQEAGAQQDNFRKSGIMLALTFGAYAVFAGIITTPLSGIPPQFVRMICALVAAYYLSFMLNSISIGKKETVLK